MACLCAATIMQTNQDFEQSHSDQGTTMPEESTAISENRDMDDVRALETLISGDPPAGTDLDHLMDIQCALNSILTVTLEPISLAEMLRHILLRVLNIPWLSLEEKGCIFLSNENSDVLEMAVSHNLGESLLSMCNQVSYGRCLCGKAAQTRKPIFKNCVDSDHENRPAGSSPHGHYNIPIVSGDRTLGVLNLYVRHGHVSCEIEVQFLDMVSNILASLIERKQSESRLKLLSRAVDASGSMVMITDLRGTIEYVNPAFSTVTGYTREELIGKSPRILQAIKTSDEVYQQMRASILSGSEWRGEFYNSRKNGDRYWSRSIVTPVRDEDGEITQIVSIQEDITKEQELVEKLSYRTTHDELTGLINRREFESRMHYLLSQTQRSGTRHSLLYMDLDQFKLINDGCGHHAGDQMLRQITHLIRSKIRDADIMGRLGGDEFAILMAHCSEKTAIILAERLLNAVSKFQFNWHGQLYRTGVSIGLVGIDEHCADSVELMKRADAACYRAKNLGRNRLHIYQEQDQGLVEQQHEMRWVKRINRALDEDRFILFAQPIVPVRNPSDIAHFELLLRMLDREGGIIPPGAFLPSAERYHLMAKLDRWVIEETCTLFQRYSEFQNNSICLSVNISGQSIADDGFLDYVVRKIREHGINPASLCFEITETSAISNLKTASHFISILRAMGCTFSLDDFGSGLSSFGYLKNLQVDYLKIDGMFVREIVQDPIDRAMVKSINEVAQVMGMKTVAEFVEDNDILDELCSIGVDYAQGYGTGRPVPVSELWTVSPG